MAKTNKGTLIAEGAYTFSHGDASTGHETWRLDKLAHGGMVFTSRAEVASPKISTLDLVFEVTQNWAPVRVSARREAEGKSLTSEQRATGGQWQARIEPRGETAQAIALDFGTKHEIGFISPAFLTPTLFRLNLQVGQSREVDAIAIDLTTFVPRTVRLNYACVAAEGMQVTAGKFAAWHYTVNEEHFWADRNGVVLVYQTPAGDTMKLARYRRTERRQQKGAP